MALSPEERKRLLAFGAPSAALLALSIYLFRHFSVSVEKAIIFPSGAFASFFTRAAEAGPLESFQSIAEELASFVLPFIPLAMGLGILVAYGATYGEDRRLGLMTGSVSLLALLLFNFTIPSLLFALALFASCFLSTGLGFTFFQELKKWKSYRAGTHAVGRMLLMINVLLTLAVFLTAAGKLESFEDAYIEQTTDVISSFGTGLFLGNIPLDKMVDQDLVDLLGSIYPGFKEEYAKMSSQEKQDLLKSYRENIGKQAEVARLQIKPQVEKLLDSKESRLAIDFSILMSPLFIFGVLESVKSLVLCPIAGIVTAAALAKRRKDFED